MLAYITRMEGRPMITLFAFAIPLLEEMCKFLGILTKHFREKINSIP